MKRNETVLLVYHQFTLSQWGKRRRIPREIAWKSLLPTVLWNVLKPYVDWMPCALRFQCSIKSKITSTVCFVRNQQNASKISNLNALGAVFSLTETFFSSVALRRGNFKKVQQTNANYVLWKISGKVGGPRNNARDDSRIREKIWGHAPSLLYRITILSCGRIAALSPFAFARKLSPA